MKRLLLILSAFTCFAVAYTQNVRTSVMDGLGSNPLVWDCTCFPLPNDSIIINHNIILNVDFGFTDGAVVINPGGSLIGDTPNRNFAFSNSANFINNGIFDVARVGFFGGAAYNGGTFTADSFYTSIATGPGWVSNGNMNVTYSYWNTGTFVLGSSADLIVGDNFYNGDSAISGVNAVLVSNGDIRVNGDFANSDTIRGIGDICIFGNSVNLGVITGTLDMCDVSGGAQVDLNWGTISGSVTTCTGPCNLGLGDNHSVTVEVYPNPAADWIRFDADVEIQVSIYDVMGKLVYQSSQSGIQQNISVNEWASGVYTYRIVSGSGSANGKFIKQ